jgi:hypothetical protein
MKPIVETVEMKFNVEIDIFERGKRRRWHQQTHNIVVNNGRQFMAELITPASLGAGTFTRTQDTIVRYIGFGIGGSRQSSPVAGASPYSDAAPAGYGGTNAQTDVDVTVGRLERPVRVTTGPDVWMKQIAAPGTFDAGNRRTTFIATFSESDINFGSFTSVPISEIGLYKSSADPTLPNGGAGAYPGPTSHLIAYDTFDPFAKTGAFNIEARWQWRFG